MCVLVCMCAYIYIYIYNIHTLSDTGSMRCLHKAASGYARAEHLETPTRN